MGSLLGIAYRVVGFLGQTHPVSELALALAARGDGGGGGPGPPGVDAFTTTSAAFVQPAVLGNVNVSVGTTAWMVPTQVVYVAGGGYYQIAAIVDGVTVTLTNLGYPGNAAPAAVIASPAGVSPSGLEGPAGTPGAPGPPGAPGAAGVNAFTTTTANFVQPAAGANVNVSVVSTAWMVATQVVYVAGGGYYTVAAIIDGVTVTLKNLAYNGNAAPAAVIASPAGVSPGGLAGQPIIVATPADLTALDGAALGLVLGSQVVVTGLLGDTFVVTSTALASDANPTGPFRIIAGTNLPVGTKYARRGDTNEVAKRQTAWFVSAATGSDLNSGSTSLTPLKTVDEIWLRTGGVFPNNATITVIDGDMALAGPFHIASASAASRNRLNITGTPPVIRTGSIVAVTPRVGNTLASVQGSGQLDDGYIIRMTSGAQNGKVAPILENTGSPDTVNIPPTFATEAGASPGMPAPGDTYELLNPAQNIALSYATNIEVTCKYFRLPSRPQGVNVVLNCCRIDTLDSSQTSMSTLVVNSSAVGANGTTIECGALSLFKFSFCSFRSAMRITDGSSTRMLSTVHKDTTSARAIIEIGGGADALSTWSTSASAEFNDLGVSGSSACAIRVGPLGTVKNNNFLYGASNTGNAVEVNGGGRLVLDATAPDPTITATVNELSVDNQTSLITPLTAGGPVNWPAAMNTWAAWVTNFGRTLFNYITGSAVQRAV